MTLFQFASLLMGISNTFATIPGIVSPTITGHIVSHRVRERTLSHWELIVQ